MIVYASFDVFPSPKGAATHIAAFTQSLGKQFGGVELVTVGRGLPLPTPSDDPSPRPPPPPVPRDLGSNVTHYALPARGKTMIDRVMCFRHHLMTWWRGRRPRIAHVRSIYEGYPLVRRKRRMCERLIYEVNGLPSIELKYHYPDVATDRELLLKLRTQEERLLRGADLLITPSGVTGELLQARGAPPEKVRVIPNGVDLERFRYAPPRPWSAQGPRLLYSGTMTAWQGVFVALEAVRLYLRDAPATLTLVGPAKKHQKRKIEERCRELGINHRVEILEPLPQDELVRLHHACDLVLAPLLANDRNKVQGCCPLKVIEAMATGTPVVSSNLPVVRALAESETEALLVRAGSAKQIKDAIARLRDDPNLALSMSKAARARIEREFTWERAGRSLVAAYEEVLDTIPT